MSLESAKTGNLRITVFLCILSFILYNEISTYCWKKSADETNFEYLEQALLYFRCPHMKLHASGHCKISILFSKVILLLLCRCELVNKAFDVVAM